MPIYAKAALPYPDSDEDNLRLILDRVFRKVDEFDRWVDVPPEAVGTIMNVSDDKPIPRVRRIASNAAWAGGRR